MAGSNYRLLLEGQLDASKVQAQINALSNKSVMNIKTQFDSKDIAKFEQELNRIRAVAASVGKISLFGDASGGINKAVVEYTDKIGNIKTEYLKINESVGITQKYTQNLAKDEAAVVKLKQETVKLTAKQADEMHRAQMNAEKFLARSQNMAQTPSVMRAQDTAGQIKQAVSDGDISKVRQLNDQLAIQKASLQQVTSGMAGWANGIQSAIKRVAELALGVGLVYGAMNQLRKGIDYVSELNKEMTKIQVLQIEGASTNDEIATLADNYNLLAKEVGATTVEVAQGSVEWLRQGKSIDETTGLLRSTMMLSKLGALESAEATEFLTSILNGYQMEAEEASTIVDKLVAVDNKAATSAGELATALQYVSAVAHETGVEFDEMTSIIATISSVTRVSAETIGQGMKTMLTRMRDIRWRGIDETGVSINNVEKSLRDVDIALRDTPDSFRPLGDVLKDLSGKWVDLTEVQQANIGKAIAGTRQVNLFTVLMQNYNKVLEFNKIQLNSVGLAQQRYAIYLESVEAKQNKMKASWEALWQSTITSDTVKKFYELGAAAIDAVTASGGLIPVLQTIILLMVALNAQFISKTILGWITSIQAAGVSLMTFGTTLRSAIAAQATFGGLTGSLTAAFGAQAVAIGAMSIALIALVGVVYEYNRSIKDTQENGMEQITQAWRDSFAEVTANGGSALDYLEKYRKGVAYIRDEYEKLSAWQKLFVNENDMVSAGLQEGINAIAASSESYAEYNQNVQRLIVASGLMVDEQGRVYEEFWSGTTMLKRYGDQLNITTEEQWLMNAAEVEAAIVAEDQVQAYTSLADAVSKLHENTESLLGLMDKANEGKLQFGDLEELAKAYPDYLDALREENGQLKLNTDMVREYMLQKSEQSIADAREAGATQQEIEVLKLYHEQLSRGLPLSKDYVDNFNKIMEVTSTGLRGEAQEEFKQLGQSIHDINNQFQEGQISAEQYFNLLNEKMQQADFEKMFANNQNASQSFFSGMVMNATSALTEVSSQFDAGKINIAEYTSQLSQVGGLFETIGGIVASSGEMMGMTSEQIDAITSSTDGLTNSLANMNAMQEVNNLLIGMSNEAVQFGSEGFSNYARAVSEAMFASGQSWHDAAGNALTSSQAIYQYATAADGNMSQLASQAANKTNGVIQKVAGSVANLLRGIADSIRNFKGGISFTPRLVGGINFDAIIGGQPIQNWISVPSIQFDIAGQGNLSFASIASSLESFASGLESSAGNLNLDLSIYTNPGSINQATGAVGGLGGAVNDLANSLGGASNAADDLTKKLKDAEKAAIDALKAQLKAYKDVIDERKRLLASMEKEREYQDDVEDKNSEILRIQNELAALQFDTSEEANARRLQLEEDLAKAQEELQDMQYSHSIDKQTEALDNDYRMFEQEIEEAIAAVQGISATSLQDFAAQLASILSQIQMPTSSTGTRPPPPRPTASFHDGMEAGFVGGVTSMASNEVFAKLMTGEGVVTPMQMDNFIRRTLPEIASSGGGDVNIEMPINVQGNLDKTVIPDLERIIAKVVKELNSNMFNRGLTRRVDQFA